MGRFDIDGDGAPFALEESGDTQDAACDVAGEDGEPDVERFERAETLNGKADAERDRDLRDDRNIERAFCVAGALQPAGVG